MTATAGIKKHGQAAVDALLQEFCQLDSKNVFEPRDASTLTASQKREALRALNLIKEKRSGKLKGRACADGCSKKVLYLQLLKALYGCVQSALLWYNLFLNTLVQLGFKLNPYDLCVANSQIKGKQCTIAWYVDDNKISHVDGTVVTEIIEKIEAKFGKMTVTRGKHTCFWARTSLLTTTTAPSQF